MSSSELKILVNSSANSIHILRSVMLAKMLQDARRSEKSPRVDSSVILIAPSFESPRFDRALLRLLRRAGRRGDESWEIGVRELLHASDQPGQISAWQMFRQKLLFSRRGSLFDLANFRPRGRVEITEKLHLEWVDKSPLRRLKFRARSWLWVLKVLLKHQCSPQRVKVNFRNIRYKGVLVGDLALAQALRYDPKAGGCARDVRGFLTALRMAAFQRELGLVHSKLAGAFIVPGERTYLSWVYVRSMAECGEVIISSDSFGQLALRSAGDVERWTGKVFSNELEEENLLSAGAKLQQRVMGNDLSLRWGSGSDRDLTSTFWPRQILQGQDLMQLISTNVAVVFLHSFNDGVFFYGVDDFDGYFGWAEDAIRGLLEIGFNQVLVKPHPNALLGSNPLRGRSCDWYGQRKLLQNFLGEQRVSLCSSLLTPSDFRPLTKALFVSHSSNVVPELAFLEKCVLASTFSPWGSEFCLSHLYSNREELLEKAGTILSSADFANPSECKSEAIRFVASQSLQSQRNEAFSPLKFLSAQMHAYGFEVQDELIARGMLGAEWVKRLND